MPNDITVTKNTTSGSERWDVAYTADQAATITKTFLTAGDLLDRNIKVSITTPSGSATTPTTSVTLDSKSMNINSSTGVVTSTMSGSANITPTISAGYISAGTAGTVSASGSQTLQLTTQSGATVTPTTTEQTAVSAGRYTLGAIKVAGDANLVAGNIKTGVSIFGVNGSYSGQSINNQQKSVDPSETAQTVTPDSGYTGLSEVNVSAISSTYVGSGITRRSSSDLSASGTTVTAPAGYYANSASASVASMTLPTAASSSSSGTSKATIGRSTSDQYINIPTGYNGTASYYKISATPNGSATGPSSLSASSATVTTGTNTITLTKTGVTTTPTVSAGYVSSATASTATVALTASVTVNPTPTASGATVTIPAGYYSEQTTKSVSSGSATGPSSLSASSATVSTGTNTITLTKTGVTTTPTVSAGYVSSATASTATVALTASVTTKAAATITPTTTDQTIASGTYLTGAQTISGDANLVAGNIKNGVTIFGVTGTMPSGSVVMSTTQDSHGGDILTITSGVDTVYLQTKTATPSESQQTISPDTGNLGLSEVVVSAIPSNYVGSGITQRTSSDVIIASGNVNVPVGYYGTAVTKPYPGYELITSKEYTINWSSTTNTLHDTIALGSSCYTSNKILYVKVRDKAGPRSGYFTGSDTYFYNFYAAREATTTLGTATGDKLVTVHRVASNGQPTSYGRVNAAAYGIYGYSIDSSGNLTIYKVYNSTYSLTINGTYVVEVYLAEYPPTGNPYSYSYS